MWLVEGETEWEPLPSDGVRSTDVALRLLGRTQALLADGETWRSESLAHSRTGEPCDPLSEDAHQFSLGGAAARARWEMREELADAEISPQHVRQVMNAVFAVTKEYDGEASGGWAFANAVLDGMRFALEEYREHQVRDMTTGAI